jgi:hypothetical protein
LLPAPIRPKPIVVEIKSFFLKPMNVIIS